MAAVVNGSLSTSPLSSRSSSSLSTQNKLRKSNFIQFQVAKVRNVSSNDTRVSERRIQQNRLTTTISRNANDNNYNPNVESKIKIDECLHLLSKCNPGNSSCCGYKQIHAKFVKLGAFKSDSLIGNKLIILYSKNRGTLGHASQLFDEIPQRTVPSYAALMGSYCRSDRWEDMFSVFGLMIHDGNLPDKYLLPTIIKACSAMKYFMTGKMVHGFIVRKVFLSDVYIGNALIDFYSNCGDLESSKSVFNTMNKRDVVSWTALVSAYMKEGLVDDAQDVFKSMQSNGVNPDLISWNSLASGFARNGEIDLALKSFKEMQEKGLKPRVNSWNGIISGCVQNGSFETALDVFRKMMQVYEEPDVVTIASILPACAELNELNLGKSIHGYSLKRKICENKYVAGSLIEMYSKRHRNDYAKKVFISVREKNTTLWNEMIAAYVNDGKINEAVGLLRSMRNEGTIKPDVITYNTVLSGYARNGQKNEACELLSEMTQMDLRPNIVSYNILISGFQQYGLSYEALKYFRLMQNGSISPNSVTITSALAACADLNLLHLGKEIHGFVLRNSDEHNIFVSCALIDMYAKCHLMGVVEKVFWRVQDKNTVCFNILISGFMKNNQVQEGFDIFHIMLEQGLQPSSVTFMILLSACGDISALRIGRQLHGYIVRSLLEESENALSCALVEMYSKCGSIVEAELVFDSQVEKDVALWNSMISAYSVHGMSKKAIALFEQMERSGAVPDKITFIALLLACKRDVLIEEGWKYFKTMDKSYGIVPSLEHYTCMVGIMGGAGLLNEALDFVTQMPYEADACTWATLLQYCRVHSNLELGEKAAKALFELEPNNASNYILLSNIYVSLGMWDSAKNLRSLIKSRKLLTTKECSFINVGTKIYTFKGGECSHSNFEEILDKWDELAMTMENDGYFPLDPLCEEEEADPFFCLHTEKLAICYGIISSDSHRPIRVSKNIRMCIDCHTSAKLISKITKMEIFVKDVSFYHHMINGICSCQDRW